MKDSDTNSDTPPSRRPLLDPRRAQAREEEARLRREMEAERSLPGDWEEDDDPDILMAQSLLDEDKSGPAEPAEGYVKYEMEFTPGPAPALDAPLQDLIDLRTRLWDLDLIGEQPDGVGFGNVSIRRGEGFVVSATATGGIPELGTEGFSTVTGFSLSKNRLSCTGLKPASSEALTHGAVYLAQAGVGCVIHVHSRRLFFHLLRTPVPATPASAAYGSPAMADAVARIVSLARVPSGVLVMSGHLEGVLAWGPDCKEAEKALMEVWNEARED